MPNVRGKSLERHLMTGFSQSVQVALRGYELAQFAEIVIYRWIHGHVLRKENHYPEAKAPLRRNLWSDGVYWVWDKPDGITQGVLST